MTPRTLSRRAALLGTFAAGLLVACGGDEDHYSPPTTPGDRAAVRVSEHGPEFALLNAARMPVSLNSFRGKPTILVFFRTFG